MATTFQVIYLGTTAELDPTEGNVTNENAGALVGLTFGGLGDPLVDRIQTLSAAVSTTGVPEYTRGSDATSYDSNNSLSNEAFRIDGGPRQVHDTTVVYNATLTYIDGTTANITAVVFQDTNGRLYLAPEITQNADQTALEALPIRSLTINSVAVQNATLSADRNVATFVVCFASGTAIRTPRGDVAVEDLKAGDLVETLDNGPQPVRWIGRTELGPDDLDAAPNMRPVTIRKDVIGNARDLTVSPQHGLLIGDRLVRARHLAETAGTGVRIARGKRSVTYLHLMFDSHQVVFAEDAPSESFYPGPMAQRMLSEHDRQTLGVAFPGVLSSDADQIEAVYGPPARPYLRRGEVDSAWRSYLDRATASEPVAAV